MSRLLLAETLTSAALRVPKLQSLLVLGRPGHPAEIVDKHFLEQFYVAVSNGFGKFLLEREATFSSRNIDRSFATAFFASPFSSISSSSWGIPRFAADMRCPNYATTPASVPVR